MDNYPQACKYLERINCIVQRAGVKTVDALASKALGSQTGQGPRTSFVSMLKEAHLLITKIRECGYIYVKGRYSVKTQTYSKPYIRKN